MAYVIQVEVTKPDLTLWFIHSSVDALATVNAIDTWNSTQPGFLSSFVRMENTKLVSAFIFDTKANGDAWLAARETQPDWMARTAYYTSINATVVVTIL